MKKYFDFVEKGKVLVLKLKDIEEFKNCYQAKIAKYAISVCEICHGGISTNKYTIKDYALDIGLNPKTVQGWVQVYRNVLCKIGIDEPTIEEWRKACKANNILRLDRIINNKENGKPGTRSAYKKRIPKDEIKNIYESIDEKPFVGECHSLINNEKSSNHLLRRKMTNLNELTEPEIQQMEKTAKYTNQILNKRDLDIAGDKRLIHLMEVLDDSSEIINEFLTRKKKKVV